MDDAPDVTSGLPDDGTRDPLAFIDDAVAEITPADVRKRLNETLRQAGYRPTQPDGSDLVFGTSLECVSLEVELGGLLGFANAGTGLEAPLARPFLVIDNETALRRQTHQNHRQLIQRAYDFMPVASDGRQRAYLWLAAARAEASPRKSIAQPTRTYVDKTLTEASQGAREAHKKDDQIVAEARKAAYQIIFGAHKTADQMALRPRDEIRSLRRSNFRSSEEVPNFRRFEEQHRLDIIPGDATLREIAVPQAARFGPEVRRLRMTAGKSLARLGAEVHMSRSQLGKIEQGDARGSREHALALDKALGADGRLTELFRQEHARIDLVVPDLDILSRSGPVPPDVRGVDLAERAARAAARLQELRVRSHQAGPRSILGSLGDEIAELYGLAGGTPDPASPLWPTILRYAELLGWTAEETCHDTIAMRWTRAMADWAACLGDGDALGYAWIRQSEQARRRGDAEAAAALARRAGALGGISRRIAQFAAEREAQALALAGDEPGCHRALERFHTLAAGPPQAEPRALLPGWGPEFDPAFERSRLPDATCLVDLGEFRTAMALFDEGMPRLGAPRTGHARLAVRHAIACAHADEPEHACDITRQALPTIARQGSASLRGDLKWLTKVLNRYSRSSAVRSLLPDLTVVARGHTASEAERETIMLSRSYLIFISYWGADQNQFGPFAGGLDRVADLVTPHP